MNREELVWKGLAGLNGLMALWSAFIFLSFLKIPFSDWLVINVCAPIQLVTVLALASRNKTFMSAMIPPLLYFGVGGMFVFGWQGYMAQGQLNHLLMVVTAAYIFSVCVNSPREEDLGRLRNGLWLGIIAVLVMELVVFPLMAETMSPETVQLLQDMGFNRG